MLDDFTSVGLTDPLAWFAAAEIARDDLEARLLARGLFLAYADADPGDPWVPKALLAALAVASDDTDRAWLLGRLETHAVSPYVLAARGEPAPGLRGARGGFGTAFEGDEQPMRLGTELFGVHFQNPVLLAAGTCGFGQEVSEVVDLESLGGFVDQVSDGGAARRERGASCDRVRRGDAQLHRSHESRPRGYQA